MAIDIKQNITFSANITCVIATVPTVCVTLYANIDKNIMSITQTKVIAVPSADIARSKTEYDEFITAAEAAALTLGHTTF